MMSSEATDDAEEICASCGIPACDIIKLKLCNACKSVRYCSVACQKWHLLEHKEACKKRVAEFRDELLFRQPESTHLGDCPICFIPLPIGNDKSSCMFVSTSCCSKSICDGCEYANQSLVQKCPFCRTHCPKNNAEAEIMLKKRMEANDPVALEKMGYYEYCKGDYIRSFEYYTKAAELGDMDAHHSLGFIYLGGKGVARDMMKAIYHTEEAAIGGHPNARCNLGIYEREWGNHERAMKHFIIAANQGLNDAVEQLKESYAKGHVSKDDFAAALRAYQRAVDATKSPQREAARRDSDFQIHNLFTSMVIGASCLRSS